ncbi:3-hydroxyacyl-CoA dehydrogenase family protein [Acidobacteriota bacterium]
MKEISKVGIIGAGTMGRRIAFSCIINGVYVCLYDINPSAVAEAEKAIQKLIRDREADGRLNAGTWETVFHFLSASSTLENCVHSVDLVVETVTEDLSIKRNVFTEIDKHAPSEALIGTNTSSIPGSRIADVMQRPEKVFNFNFGSVDNVKVEVMGNPKTSVGTIDAIINFLKTLQLVPLVVRKEIMGYASNRVWRAVKKEVLFLLDGGYSTPEDIDRSWMLQWNTSLGPCGLMDKIGLDVVRDIEMVYYEESGDPSDRPPKMLDEMIEQNKLGVKTGVGFYTYPNPEYMNPGWLKKELPLNPKDEDGCT